MRSTADTHKERSQQNMENIKKYAKGSLQRTFVAENEGIDVDNGASDIMQSGISSADFSAASDSLHVDVMDLTSNVALKRDIVHTYAERKYLMASGFDSKLGDEFRGIRDYKRAELLEPGG